MPELTVLHNREWEITRCWNFEETDSALILFNDDEERKGWIPKQDVGKIIPVEEQESDDD